MTEDELSTLERAMAILDRRVTTCQKSNRGPDEFVSDMADAIDTIRIVVELEQMNHMKAR
jgi:hypothetical protein